MGSARNRGHAGRRRQQAVPPRREQRTAALEARAVARLDAQRERLAGVLSRAGRPLLRGAARRLPPTLREPVVDTGGRLLEEAVLRLREGSAQEWLGAARRYVREQPASSLVHLVGAGLLAGRLLRTTSDAVGGPGALLSRGPGAGKAAKRALLRLLGPRGVALLLAQEAGRALHGASRNVRTGAQKTRRDAARTARVARGSAQNAREHLREAGREAAHNVRSGLRRATHHAGKRSRRGAPPSALHPARPVHRAAQERTDAPSSEDARAVQAGPSRDSRASGGGPPASRAPKVALHAAVNRRGGRVGARRPAAPEPAGYLGLKTYPVRLSQRPNGGSAPRSGLLVAHVEPDGPAERAGLQSGDTLLTLEDAPLSQVRDLLAHLSPENVGRALRARVLRAGTPRDLTLTVASRP